MRVRTRLISWMAFLLALFAGIANAAGNGSDNSSVHHEITGTVNDALGRPVPDAELKLQTADGRIMARTRSDQKGNFVIRNIPAGTYEVVANKTGFAVAASTVSVMAGGAPRVAIALQSRSELSLKIVTTRINPQSNGLNKTGNSQYTLSDRQIASLPQGQNTSINQVLLQMPGVVQDTDQQLHIEGEHEDLQWRVNGVMMPMDSFSGFGQIFNSFFIKRMSLLTGVLPVNYGYRDAGVLDLVTKDGCSNPGGDLGFYGGQREWIQPSFEYGGCEGNFSYFYTGTYLHSNLAFSSETPGPTPIHNITNQGQGFGYFTYQINPLTKLSLTTGVSVNNSEVPNQPDLPVSFSLNGANPANFPSKDVNESINQDYYFGTLALSGIIGPRIDYQVAYTGAYSTLQFNPDYVGDLLYQGVASKTFQSGFDNTLQTDVSRQVDTRNLGSHNLGTGFYLGEFGVTQDDTTAAFPANSAGVETSNVPVTIVNNQNSINILYGVYLQDIWQMTEKLTLTGGMRFDGVTGDIDNNMISPRINLLYQIARASALHAGFARYFQTPDFQTIPAVSFTKFAGTTAAVAPGGLSLQPEKDYFWDAGVLHHFGEHLTIEEDASFRLSQNLIDLGQFGSVPVFEPFNYKNGRIWTSNTSAVFDWKNLAVRGNFSYSVAQGNDLSSGQFNFDPKEVTYIANHYIYLDHDQFYTASGGISYNWRSFLFTLTGTYGSGLRAGFANTEELPQNYQIDLGMVKSWQVPTIGKVITRIAVLNVTDHINELRNGTGIGIFQAGYGPRRSVFGGINVPLPPIGGINRTR